LKELSKLVAAGDAAALGELRRILDSNEAIWRQVGDVADVSQKILIEALSGDSAIMVEGSERHVAELKQSLLATCSSPLEAMAIQRVVCCWLLTHYLDRCVAVAVERGSRMSDLGRLQVLAEKRYQVSLRTLALVRQIEPRVTQRQQQPTGRPSEAVGTHSSTSSMASTPSTDGSADEAKPADVAA
jgi:hypothetical protein